MALLGAAAKYVVYDKCVPEGMMMWLQVLFAHFLFIAPRLRLALYK